jgi:hypothetical protein
MFHGAWCKLALRTHPVLLSMIALQSGCRQADPTSFLPSFLSSSFLTWHAQLLQPILTTALITYCSVSFDALLKAGAFPHNHHSGGSWTGGCSCFLSFDSMVRAEEGNMCIEPRARSHLHSAGPRPTHVTFTIRSSCLHLRGNSCSLGVNVTIPQSKLQIFKVKSLSLFPSYFTSRKLCKKEPQSVSHRSSFDHPDVQSLNDYIFFFFVLRLQF